MEELFQIAREFLNSVLEHKDRVTLRKTSVDRLHHQHDSEEYTIGFRDDLTDERIAFIPVLRVLAGWDER